MASPVFSLILALSSLLLADEYEPKPGDKAHLEFGDSFETAIPAAPTLAVFERMIAEVRVMGDKALEKPSVDDTIWGVENYAAVEVVRTDTGNDLAAEVKILDGPFENRTAFVLRSFIFRGPPPQEPFPEHGFSFKEKRKIMAAWLRRMSKLHGADSAPEAQRKDDSGANFEKGKDELFKRLKLTQDKVKAIGVELLMKQVHFGKELVDDNPQADRYVVTPSPELIPDPSYNPEVGDVAYVYMRSVYPKGERAGQHIDVPVCSDYLTYTEYKKSLLAHDREGYRELVEQGKLAHIRTGTKVRILDFHKFANTDDNFDRNAYEVRILDGPLKDKKVWVLASEVVRLTSEDSLAANRGDFVSKTPLEEANSPASESKLPPSDEAKEKAARAAIRAATMLRSAQNLEKLGKKYGAIDFYRMVVKDFPDSPQSKVAAERIKSLSKE